MTTEDFFGLPPAPEFGANAPQEYTVSELSHKLKRSVEDQFAFVRVRGEISKVTVAKSGHLYTALKDESAVLDAICWKGTLTRLGLTPQEGMEVVCTGKLTTYPGRSNYQMIIETMELAGQGALLKMLEDRKKKLAAEGLFDPARKKKIPFLPDIIGVVTSPTGAVIRDILHRVAERFPCRVIVWPVAVQGQEAARQVAAAIEGFNALIENRPDVIIVARGGGSLEDLMPFNDEIVVRAAAASRIPLISAVGHETDTTLIDFAADLRAPTPTAAAEKAVPVRAEILAQVVQGGQRLFTAAGRIILHAQTRVEGLARGLGDPSRRLDMAQQRFDSSAARLDASLSAWLERKAALLREMSARVSPRPLLQKIVDSRRHVTGLHERLYNAEGKIVQDRARGLSHLAALLDSLSFERVLERGYAVVYDASGAIVSTASSLKAGDGIDVRFKDARRSARIEKDDLAVALDAGTSPA